MGQAPPLPKIDELAAVPWGLGVVLIYVLRVLNREALAVYGPTPETGTN
jgi:hypothetical protein